MEEFPELPKGGDGKLLGVKSETRVREKSWSPGDEVCALEGQKRERLPGRRRAGREGHQGSRRGEKEERYVRSRLKSPGNY